VFPYAVSAIVLALLTFAFVICCCNKEISYAVDNFYMPICHTVCEISLSNIVDTYTDAKDILKIRSLILQTHYGPFTLLLLLLLLFKH